MHRPVLAIAAITGDRGSTCLVQWACPLLLLGYAAQLRLSGPPQPCPVQSTPAGCTTGYRLTARHRIKADADSTVATQNVQTSVDVGSLQQKLVLQAPHAISRPA